uniref:Uncharacterized protein n=1 Tax=Meloidogyne hapla TaxID=6305 RepID=A0A1I8B2B3_MELHA
MFSWYIARVLLVISTFLFGLHIITLPSLIVASWMLALLYVFAALNGNSGFLYDRPTLAFNEYEDIERRKLMTRFDLRGVIVVLPMPMTTLAIYGVLAVLLIKMRAAQNNKDSVLRVSLLKPEEYRLLVQSIFMFVTLNVTLLTWFLKAWIEQTSDYKIFKVK